MSAQAAFREIATRLLEEPHIEGGKAFHAVALKARGRIFAMLVNDELVVKLPAEHCAQLVEGGTAHPFQSGRRTMREWVAVPYSSSAQPTWRTLAEQALAFVQRRHA